MHQILNKKILPLLFLFLCFNLSLTSFASEPVIVVILSKDIKPYHEALSGFEGEVQKNGYKVSFSYVLDGKSDNESQLVGTIKSKNPNLVFTVGTPAALFAKKNLNDVSVVFSMVLNPVENGVAQSVESPGNNLTGVSLDIPPGLQFQKLTEMLPKATRIGVIYNAKEQEWLKEIQEAAQKKGLTLIAKAVNSQSDVPASLDEIVQDADCLWAQVDPMIFNAQSSQYILLTLLRKKIPMMAFSSQYVKAGALLALECDYTDIGRQSAEIAVKILKQGAFGSMALVSPEKVRLVINKKIAGVLGIDIPRNVSDEAAEVY